LLIFETAPFFCKHPVLHAKPVAVETQQSQSYSYAIKESILRTPISISYKQC